ncbi:putative transposase-like protein [Trichonephila clavata]|uniref:Putative transposase-like protein n=1 Tax=Trichonephila clavata TaxID=2740835 RepID=A0A8X6KB08_TRICU|nr:putative transposase-like protein [Trichonephila clavata]
MIESSVNICGSGVIVEIDESKFGKRVEDCWKSYDCLSNEGFVHLKVNHSVSFKEPDTAAHTNTIEGTWGAVKRGIPTSKAKCRLDYYLAE